MQSEHKHNTVVKTGLSPLQLAARTGSIPEIVSILAEGAGVDEVNYLGEFKSDNPFVEQQTKCPALYLAMERGHRLAAQVLLAFGADKGSALKLAVQFKNQDVGKELAALQQDPELPFTLIAIFGSEYKGLVYRLLGQPLLEIVIDPALDKDKKADAGDESKVGPEETAIAGLIELAANKNRSHFLNELLTVGKPLHRSDVRSAGYWALEKGNSDMVDKVCRNPREKALALCQLLHDLEMRNKWNLRKVREQESKEVREELSKWISGDVNVPVSKGIKQAWEQRDYIEVMSQLETAFPVYLSLDHCPLESLRDYLALGEQDKSFSRFLVIFRYEYLVRVITPANIINCAKVPSSYPMSLLNHCMSPEELYSNFIRGMNVDLSLETLTSLRVFHEVAENTKRLATVVVGKPKPLPLFEHCEVTQDSRPLKIKKRFLNLSLLAVHDASEGSLRLWAYTVPLLLNPDEGDATATLKKFADRRQLTESLLYNGFYTPQTGPIPTEIKRSPINTLPNQILGLICNWLDPKSSASAAGVSQRFYCSVIPSRASRFFKAASIDEAKKRKEAEEEKQRQARVLKEAQDQERAILPERIKNLKELLLEIDNYAASNSCPGYPSRRYANTLSMLGITIAILILVDGIFRFLRAPSAAEECQTMRGAHPLFYPDDPNYPGFDYCPYLGRPSITQLVAVSEIILAAVLGGLSGTGLAGVAPFAGLDISIQECPKLHNSIELKAGHDRYIATMVHGNYTLRQVHARITAALPLLQAQLAASGPGPDDAKDQERKEINSDEKATEGSSLLVGSKGASYGSISLLGRRRG